MLLARYLLGCSLFLGLEEPRGAAVGVEVEGETEEAQRSWESGSDESVRVWSACQYIYTIDYIFPRLGRRRRLRE
jgi:hypothetical protein